MSDTGESPILLARQPFLNSRRAVFGYELTFHVPSEDKPDPQHEAEQILSSLGEHFDPLVLANGRSVFVRLTPQTILDESYAVLPPSITIIELNATGISWDEPFAKACAKLKSNGYRLCLAGSLDDLGAVGSATAKFDFFKLDHTCDFLAPDCAQRIANLRNPDTSVIASGIEELEEFERAKDAGFDLFEGYFFFKPQVLEKREIPLSQMNQINFLQAVNQPDMNVDKLEKLIRSDASLSVGLLRLINSAAFGIKQQVSSINRALLLLGPKKVRQWATSLVTKQLAGDKPKEIISTCLLRAFFCESLGTTTKTSDSPLDLFMTGIISGLPAMLDVPMLRLLDELSVGDEIRKGLRGDDTAIGRIFTLACAHENGEFTAMTKAAAALNIDIGVLAKLYQSMVGEVQAILGQSQLTAAA